MLNKIFFSLVLSSVCFLNSQNGAVALDETDETNNNFSTIRSTVASLSSDAPKKGWVFRDLLRSKRSIQYWLYESEKHPNKYQVEMFNDSDDAYLYVNRS